MNESFAEKFIMLGQSPFKARKNQKIKFLESSHALIPNAPADSFGVTLFDIDGDGDLEILIANMGNSNSIYKYSKTLKAFVDITPENFRKPDKDTTALSVADFLGNGQPCIYMVNMSDPNEFFPGEDSLFSSKLTSRGSLEMEDLFEKQSQLRNPYDGRSVTALDVSGRGQHAFYVSNDEGPSLCYLFNHESGLIEEVSRRYNLRHTKPGRSLLAQYIVNKKSLDIFIGNDDYGNVLLCKDSHGQYKSFGKNLQNSRSNTRGVAVADFNGNGLADLVVVHWEARNSILMQNSQGVFENLTPPFFEQPRKIRHVIVADFDNDGKEEILINIYGDRNRMFRYLGYNEWEELNIGPLACRGVFCTGAAAGDLTGNGFLDIVMTTSREEDGNRMFLGVPNGNKWLRIMPLTQQGFPALGAKAHLIFAGGQKSQTKFICSGSGYLCQMEPVAHFGLGADPMPVQSLEITWPGNGSDEPVRYILGPEEIPSLNQFLIVPYPKVGDQKTPVQQTSCL